MASLSHPPGIWMQFVLDNPALHRNFESRLYFEARAQLEMLRKMAQPEQWGKDLKDLVSYLRFTFVRLLQEKKVIGYQVDPSFPRGGHFNTLCMNTGLITPTLNPIYAIFFRVVMNGMECFQLLFFADSIHESRTWNGMRNNSSGVPLAPSPPYQILPKRAWYFNTDESYKNLIFDPNVPCDPMRDVYMPHIIGVEVQNLSEEEARKRRARFPLKYRDIQQYSATTLTTMVKASLERTLIRAAANPRLAVPQFFRDKNATEGEIQLLLPINLSAQDFNADPDCAIVLKRTVGENGEPVYKAVSLLALSWARRNARVIFPVDPGSWLNASSLSEADESDDDESASTNTSDAEYRTESHKLFVKNIPAEATIRDLEKFFQNYGKIQTKFLVGNAERTFQFAIVTFETNELARKALRALQNAPLQGRPLSLAIYRPMVNDGSKQQHNGFGGMDDEVKKKPKEKERASSEPAANPSDAPQSKRQFSTNAVRLYVSNLPYGITKRDMEELFAPYRATKINLHHRKIKSPAGDRFQPIGSADVTLESGSGAAAAIRDLNGVSINDRTITVQFYQERE